MIQVTGLQKPRKETWKIYEESHPPTTAPKTPRIRVMSVLLDPPPTMLRAINPAMRPKMIQEMNIMLNILIAFSRRQKKIKLKVSSDCLSFLRVS